MSKRKIVINWQRSFLNTGSENLDEDEPNQSSASFENETEDLDEYFMSIAFLTATRSHDPRTKVGACIINEDNNIVGVGYNDMPTPCDDGVLPWGKNKYDRLYDKVSYVCHSELNAILNKNIPDLKNCKIYVSLFPCNECAKCIIQTGIKEVIYLSDKLADKIGTRFSREMLDLANVKYRLWIPKNMEMVINFNQAI